MTEDVPLRRRVSKNSKAESKRKRDIKAEEISSSVSDNETEFSTHGKVWTHTETENLRRGLGQFKGNELTNWAEVSRMVGTRTVTQCKWKAYKTKQKSAGATMRE
jgi:hypothetical protein